MERKKQAVRRDADLEGRDPLIATTLARGLRLLRAFHSHDDDFIGNKELAERTGLPKATVSRLCYTLVQLGYLSQDSRTGAYALAAGVLAPAYTFLSRLDIRRTAQPFMRKIATRPGLTVTLSTRHELRMTAIESVVADSHVPIVGLFGGRASIARTAVGHAYLAGLPKFEHDELIAEMKNHYKDTWPAIEKSILRDINHVNNKGFCIVRGEWGEWKEKISGVACPIVVGNGNLVFSLSAGGPSQLLTTQTLQEMGGLLCEARAGIERAVGRPHPGYGRP